IFADFTEVLPALSGMSQTTPVLGGPLVSWKVFWLFVLPVLVTAVFLFSIIGPWYVSSGLGGIILLYLVIEVTIILFFKNHFQLWALQRPENLLARLLLPPVEIVDSISAGNTNNAMITYRNWGTNFCASGQVWLGSHADVTKAVQNPQGRSFWLGEHPLLPSSLPQGESGRCVFLLSLSSKAAGGTGDHEAFRKCMVDTLLGEASVARESDAISQQLMEQCAEDFMKQDAGFDFYYGADGGNQSFWTKYLHHVLFGLDIQDKEVMSILNAFYTGQLGLMHYLDPMGHFFSQHEKIAKVADLYETSPAFSNFEVKTEYNNMTAKELALLMSSIIRIAGVQGSRMLTWFCTSGVKYGNLQIDARTVWDSLDLEDEDEVLRYILEVARLSPPVTVSHHVATEPFSCEIAKRTYSFPKGTKVAIPLVFANIDPNVWGEDVWEFNHNRPGLKENHTGFNSVNGLGPRECPGKGLVLRSMVRLLQAIFSTLVASLTSHAAFLNKSGEERRNEFRLLRKFLARSQVDEELALRIQRFLEHAHALTKEVVDEIQVPLLRLLSKPLWRELRYAMYKHTLGEIGFVRSLSRCSVSDDLNSDATRQLSQALSQRLLAAGDTIFESGSMALDAYFLVKPSVYILGQLRQPVSDRWVAEMGLWCPWLHLGELVTTEASVNVRLQVEKFSECLRRSWALLQLAQHYAAKFVQVMNETVTITDIWQCPASLGGDPNLWHTPTELIVVGKARVSPIPQ
ncbi:CYP77A2, partial [Symbiodinium sp. CCMP2456]